MDKSRAILCFAILCPLAHADQGGFSNTGGSLSSGSPVTSPAGTLTISGNALTFSSADGTTAINGTFSTSSTVENCYGGGKGGHTTCSYTFAGTFGGTLSTNGATEAIVGSTSQTYSTSNVVESGLTGYNSAYTPIYFSNSGQLLRSDDLNGTNLVSYGTQGGGVGQFYGAYGIALDSSGRIYVADTYNDRIVRIDDFSGTNWTTYGTYGSGTGQFWDPAGIGIDASGRIYILDTGNNRLVAMDDMNGTNWAAYTTLSNGTDQLGSLATPSFDSSGRFYFVDAANKRIVRMDDLSGTNWTTLRQSADVNGYIYSFYAPEDVAVDSAGNIYVLDAGYTQPSVVRVSDMSGDNWTSLNLAPGSTPHSMAVDGSGMVLVGGGGAQTVDNMSAVQQSGIALTGSYGPYYVFGITPVPVLRPPPSAISISPSSLSFSQNVGSTSAGQTITITNFGGQPLNNLSVATGGAFAQTSTCSGTLSPATGCTVSVTFAPAALGTVSGTLNVTDSSGNLGSSQGVPLTGIGVAPTASISPGSLSFASQVVGTTSSAKIITVKNTGAGSLTLSSVTAAAPFSATNGCTSTLATNATCTIQVTFSPTATGAASGSVTISDNAGTGNQSVSLSGSSTAAVSLSPISLNFGSVSVGKRSGTKSVTVTNHLGSALSFTGVNASGPFAIATNTCGSGIAANARCTIGVTFAPTVSGSASGTLSLGDSAVNSPQTVSLSGTGR